LIEDIDQLLTRPKSLRGPGNDGFERKLRVSEELLVAALTNLMLCCKVGYNFIFDNY
jgi:hypothetical protein